MTNLPIDCWSSTVSFRSGQPVGVQAGEHLQEHLPRVRTGQGIRGDHSRWKKVHEPDHLQRRQAGAQAEEDQGWRQGLDDHSLSGGRRHSGGHHGVRRCEVQKDVQETEV
ncbi:hypothetical protein PMAYCL1PPCAC_23380, partial [Pristionchus mayeri]